LDIAVTSGDSYTAAVSVYATQNAAQRMGIELAKATLAVVGATGAIGGAVSQLLVSSVGRMLLIGRHPGRLAVIADKVHAAGDIEVITSTNVSDIREADVVITVTSAGGNLIQPDMLKRGAVVCDVSRPRDVSVQVTRERDDVLVIDGGLVRVPGNVDFGFNYGLPADLTYGCFAETITLTFESLFEDYSIGKALSVAQIRYIDALATKHGFELAALRSFEKQLPDSRIEEIKRKVCSNN